MKARIGAGVGQLALSLVVTIISLAIMVWTEPYLTIVWDEGYSLGREARIRDWLCALRDPAAFSRSWRPPVEDLVPPNRSVAPLPDEVDTRGKLLRPEALEWFWPFAREEPDGHPPVYALVGLVGDLLAPNWETLPRARLGPMIVFSLTCGAVFAFFLSRYGIWPACASAATWMFQPHLFALAHYATYDGLLTCFWVGSLLAFARAVERARTESSAKPDWRWVVVFGFLAALTMGTKVTGWFLPFPFLAWVAIYRSRSGFLALGLGLLLALVVVVLLNPPWWHDPLHGLDRFFQSNFSRAQTTPLKTLFLGRIYETPSGSLPWYNTVFWTFLVTPIGFLLLALVGVFRAVHSSRRASFGALFVAHWAFLMVLRALPNTPGHDGVRQFLPAFGLLALLAGLGAAWAVDRFGRWAKLLVVLAVVEGGIAVAHMMPVPLSYFSPLFGGLAGAARMGMEPTYYWDALQPEVLEWLNSHTVPGQKVRFCRYPTSLLYLKQTGQLRADILPTDRGDWAWYVLQNRPGDFHAVDRHLIAHGHPAETFTRCGVPLIWVFPYHEVEAWQRGEFDGDRTTGPSDSQPRL